MNRYQAQNAAVKIDGYYTPPRDGDLAKVGAAFESAKAECLTHLRAAVAHVEQMQIQEFLRNRKGAAGAELLNQ